MNNLDYSKLLKETTSSLIQHSKNIIANNDWEDVDFPSDCREYEEGYQQALRDIVWVMKTKLKQTSISPDIFIRHLTPSDAEQVIALDEESGFNVESMLDGDIAFGLFTKHSDKDILLGYCTLGKYDFCEEEAVTEHTDWNRDSYLLSDVYVREEVRGKGWGKFLVYFSIEKICRDTQCYETVYAEPFEEAYGFYKALGFEDIEESDAIMLSKENVKLL